MTKRVSPVARGRGCSARSWSWPVHPARPARPPAGVIRTPTKPGVTFQPVDHSIAPASWFRARLTLRNGDRSCALADDWRLFFSFVRQPLAGYRPGPLGDGARQQLAEQGLSLTRADEAQSGDYYVLEPTADFEPLGPGETREITLDVELWAILKSDAPAGWHISFGGDPPAWMPASALLDPERSEADDRVRRRQAPRGDARHTLRAEHRAAALPSASPTASLRGR